MATHDISLKGNQRPKFPDRCVGCELEHPGHLAKIAVLGSRSTVSWAWDAVDVASGGSGATSTMTRVHVEVPCCPKCARALERRHAWKTFLTYASGLGGAAVAILLGIKGTSWGIPKSINSFVAGIACVAVVALPVIWEFKSPPAFTITPHESHVLYEFRSARCAQEFAALNPPAAAS